LVSNLYTDDHYNNDSSAVVIKAGISEEGIFKALGIPPSVYSIAHFLDFNNDGNIDMLLDSGMENDLRNIEDSNGLRFVFLLKNTGAEGNYFFEITDSKTFARGGAINSSNEHGDHGNNQSYAFGDYDNDGYTDILIQLLHTWTDEEGNSNSAREVNLYHNNGDGSFSQVFVFNPLPYDNNPHFNGGIFDVDEETFEPIPNKKILPMTHGAVALADFNNDGWLDILTTGFCDGENTGAFVIYSNNHDGTFYEVDTREQPFRGAWESELAIADFNNDGWVDIAHFGTGNSIGKIGDIYYNNGATTPFTFTASSVEGGNGLYGISEGNVRAFDINNDGLIDIVGSGWSNVTSNWGKWAFIQNPDNTFSIDEQFGVPEDGGGFTIGDLYGRNVIDIVQFGYNWEEPDGWGCHGAVYKNTNGENMRPGPAQNVQASINGNILTVTWEAAEDAETNALALAYNVYVKNDITGEIAMIMPADIETGRIKAYEQYPALIRSDDTYKYQLKVKEGYIYTIGVQALDPSLAGGPFTTTTIKSTSGIKDESTNSALKVTTKDDGFIVECPQILPVSVYNTSGKQVATSYTNTIIPINDHGILIVRVLGHNFKIIK